MNNKRKSSESLKPSDIVYLVLVLAVVLSTLVYVFVKRLDDTPEMIDLRYVESKNNYDLSVLNSATVDDYMAVSGIGEVKANDIVNYREVLGGFDSVYQLLDLDSINEKLYEAIIEHFYFSEDTSSSESVVTTTYQSELITQATSLTTSISEEVTSSSLTTDEKDSVATSSEEKESEISLIDLNRCTESDLTALGLDQKQAKAIISLRDQIGYYSDVREIMLTGMITKETFKEIKDYLYV